MEYWTCKSWQVYNYFSKYLLFSFKWYNQNRLSNKQKEKHSTNTNNYSFFLKKNLSFVAKKTRSAYEHFFITSIFMFCTKVNISNLMKGEYYYTKLILLLKRGNLCKLFINIIYFNHIFYFRDFFYFLGKKCYGGKILKLKKNILLVCPTKSNLVI